MPVNYGAPWHRESFERFLSEGLPRLLAERMPLVGYHAEPAGRYACRVSVRLGPAGVAVTYELPRPDERGVFLIDETPLHVIPLASTEDLDVAEIKCVGEQLYDYIAEQLGEAPAHLRWDEQLAREWLPLDAWARAFLTTFDPAYNGPSVLDRTNWLAEQTNLRRLTLRKRERLFAPGQLGRACPFEVPEGPNMGRIFSIATGAAIRDGRLVVEDERPQAALGLSASMIPFLEHSEPARLLMGANMLRQWMAPPDPEPALVQTGAEPDAPGFWCGRNLLTAFISWDADTFEDGIVLSESGARRLGFPAPAEPGDKLSNRHGTKGVISRIVPDAAMPHLPDGTPIELIYSFMGLPSRMNFGQVREATMGRIARAEGRPAIVPPFAAPDDAALRARLAAAGLPEDGLEQLTLGRDGPALERRSPVGWVYWGKLIHTAASKIEAWTGAAPGERPEGEPAEASVALFPERTGRGQRQGELEYYALRAAGATETIRETYNTRAAGRPDAGSMAARLASGPVEQAGPPTPMFAALVRRLAAAGVRATLEGGRLTFAYAPPEGAQALRLARPLPHPWLGEQTLEAVGALEELPAYAPLAEANARLAQLLQSGAPEALTRPAEAQLAARLGAYLDALVGPAQLWFDQRATFSARAVIAPGGADLRYDQVGLPEEVAWQLFGPQLARAIGQEAAQARDERAAEALDELMARSWVIVNRAPSVAPHSFLAFRPIRAPGRVVRLATLACNLLDADFDGDQVAVFLPVTEAGQREAGEKLSIAAHLRRDPGLIGELSPRMDARFGLAWLSRTPAGLAEIGQIAGAPVAAPAGFVTRWTIADALRVILERDGHAAALDASERLARRGFEVARRLGVGMGPFVGAKLARPPAPAADDAAAWERYVDELGERIAAYGDYDDGDMGPLVLAAKSGARSNRAQLTRTLGAVGAVAGISGAPAIIRRSFREGLAPHELFALTATSRAALKGLLEEWERLGSDLRERGAGHGYGVLARAMRARRPGLVFALAAAAGETDPLAEPDSRLFVGLPPQ